MVKKFIRLSLVFCCFLCVITCQNPDMQIQEPFSSKRVSKSVTIYLNDGVENVFPLLGAFEEKKWVKGWTPKPIYPDRETIEEGSSFFTPGFKKYDPDFIWVVTKYEPENYVIQYLVLGENGYWTKTIQCTNHTGNQTSAVITFSFTSLNASGNKAIHVLADQFEKNLKKWENQLNTYLKS